MIKALLKKYRKKQAGSTMTSTPTGRVAGQSSQPPEGSRFLKRQSKPTDSYYRLQAFLVSEEGKKWQ